MPQREEETRAEVMRLMRELRKACEAQWELERIREKMARGELRDPDAEKGMPLGWEGIEPAA